MANVIFPIDPRYSYQVNSIFGWRDDPRHPGTQEYHGGVDIKGTGGNPIEGAPVLSIESGTVIYSGNNKTYGNVVVIQNSDGTSFLYAHMQDGSTSSIHKGDTIFQGAQIGNVGKTGNVTGPHLHLEELTASASQEILNKGSSTGIGIVSDSKLPADASPQRINPIDILNSAGLNTPVNLYIDNQSGLSNSELASGLSSSGLWNGISTPGKVSIFDGFNDDLFTPYNQGDLFRSLSSIGGDRYNLNGGWSGLSSSNSYLDGFTFNMGGSTYTLFGEDGGISLSSGSGSAYGGYNWQSDYDLFGSGSYGGGSGSRYFRPTTTMYNGLSMFGSALNHYSPLAIDLDGDGIETQHIYDDARVYFDIDNDGFAERVGWIKADDGMLALDRDGNGTIDNITELFGDYRMEAWDELKLLDSNNDDKITAADTRFNELKIWRDLNQNGVSEAGELQSLSFYNITQINITHNSMDVYQKENYISGSSTVTYGNGTTKTMYDVHFLNDNVDTWFKGAQSEQFGNTFKVKPEALLMPLSRGYGSLASLHIALTKNDTLMDFMRELKELQPANYSHIPDLVTKIMYEWAGVSNIQQSTDNTAGGSNLDVRQLRFVEAFSGISWDQLGYRNVLGEFAALDIHKGWGIIYNSIMERLLVQSTFADLFPQASYDFANDKLNLNQSYSTILSSITAKNSSDINFIMPLAHILYEHRTELGINVERINTDLSLLAHVDSLGLSDATITLDMDSPTYATDIEHGSILPTDSNILKQVDTDAAHTMDGTGFNDYLFGKGGDDVLSGHAGDDYLVGGTGNDRIEGGAGWDWLLGEDGNDTILGGDEHDYISGGTGNDFLYGENGDDQIQGGAGADYLDGGAGIDTIGYMDSSAGVNVNIKTNSVSGGDATGDTILNFENIHGSQYNDILTGNDADNVLHGEAGNDRLYGGAGNDQLITTFGASKLYGEDGNDSFTAIDGFDVFNGGAGNDIISYEHPLVNSRLHIDLTEGWGQLVDGPQVTYYTVWPDALIAKYQRGEITFAQSVLVIPAVEFFDMSADFRQLYGSNFYILNTFSGVPEDSYISIENVIGSNFADYIRGDANANSLYGHGGNDTLLGESGNDFLYGEHDDDTLTGGAGTDTFVFNRDMGHDTVTDFASNETLSFNEQYGSFTKIIQYATQVGSDTVIKFDNERSVTLTGFSKSSLTASQFQFKQVVANDVAATSTEDHSYTISVQDLLAKAGFSNDNAVGDLTVASVQGATNGAVSIVNNIITFTPNQNFNGQASFTFTISDGYTSLTTKNVVLNVAAVNDSPIANGITATINENNQYIITTANLLIGASASDIDGDTLTISSVQDATNGTVTLDYITNNITFTPGANYYGQASFTYTVSDNNGGSVVKTANLTINQVNSAPITNSISAVTVDEDSAVIIYPAQVTDIEDGVITPTASNVIFSNVRAGASVSVNNDGTFTYHGASNFNGMDTFTYAVRDSNGATTTPVTVNINVTPVNDAPVLNAAIGSQSAIIGDSFNFTVPVNTFADVDAGDSLSLRATLADGSALPSWLIFNQANGTFTGTPTSADNGNISVLVTATDTGNKFVSSTFNINITNLNHAPTVSNTISSQYAPAGNNFSFVMPGNAFNDIDGDTLTYSAKLSDGSALPAWLNFNPANRTFTGSIPSGMSNEISLSVTASDGHLTAIQNFNMYFKLNVIDGVVQRPSSLIFGSSGHDEIHAGANSIILAGAGNDIIYGNNNSDSTIIYHGNSLNGGDGNSLNGGDGNDTIYGNTGVDFIYGDAGDDILDGKEGTNYLTGGSGKDTFAISKAPGGIAYMMDFNPSDDVINLKGINGIPDFAHLNISSWGSGTKISLPDNQAVYVLNVPMSSFTAGSFSGFFTNHIPVANNIATIINKNTSYIISAEKLMSNACVSDIDGDGLAISAVQDAVNGAVRFDAQTNNIIFTPLDNYSGEASFTYTVNDGYGGAITRTATITVNASNHAPTASDINTSINEDNQYIISIANLLTQSASEDIEGDILTISSVQDANNGSVALDRQANNIIFTPAENYNGLASFNYTINDGHGGRTTRTANLNINSVNDTPVVGHQIGSQYAPAGSDFSFVVPVNAFSDIDGDTLTYSAKLSDGSALPAWLNFNPTNRAFTGSVPNGLANEISLSVTASDGHLTAIQNFNMYFKLNVIDGAVQQPSSLIFGSSGHDEIHAGANSIILAGAGNDIIYGNNNSDSTIIYHGNSLNGGDGNDTIYGNTGVDFIYGDAGDDILDGKEGTNYLTGGSGRDIFTISKAAGGVEYVMDFKPGDDVIDLKDFADIQNFAHLNMSTWGSGTKISLPDNQAVYVLDVPVSSFTTGSFTGFNDSHISTASKVIAGSLIIGTDHNDELIGGEGNDWLKGGLGADILTGGNGADSFDYSFLSDSKAGAYDTITDFQQGVDHINLYDLAVAGIINFDDLNITHSATETVITANDNISEHFELHLKGIIDLHHDDFVWGT